MNDRPDPEPELTSRRHPLAVRVRKLVRRPTAARREGIFLLDGLHLLEEALTSVYAPEAVLVAPRLQRVAAGRELLRRMESRGWQIVRMSDDLLASLTPTETPQGVLGLFRRPPGSASDRLLRRIGSETAAESVPPALPPAVVRALILGALQDPINLGVLGRAAWVFGCPALITLPGTADPFHPRALRASAGMLLRLQVIAGATAEAIARWAAREGIRLVGLQPRGGEPLFELRPLEHPIALVLGSEGSGIPSELAALCSRWGTIPMQDAAESLGVAAAGTIGLYELTRMSKSV